MIAGEGFRRGEWMEDFEKGEGFQLKTTKTEGYRSDAPTSSGKE